MRILKRGERLPLTDECMQDTDREHLPPDLVKYWYQRYKLFERYDEGIALTEDAWFGVTPEMVAQQIAYDIDISHSCPITVIDLFAGVGGNTIAFALQALERETNIKRVIAIERDPATLACAQNNADIYEVGDHIAWVQGDSFDFLAELLAPHPGPFATTAAKSPRRAALETSLGFPIHEPGGKVVLFASPPWGGVAYNQVEVFDLGKMEPYNLGQLRAAYGGLDHYLYLPRNSDLRQLAGLVPEGQNIDIVQYCIRGSSKAMMAHFPSTEAVKT